jgi:PII-like signaling protein
MGEEKLRIYEDDVRVRIYVSEKEKAGSVPLYEAIVLKAREQGLAGATVIRGIMGFGADKRMHSSKILELSENLPLVIEIVDLEENIEKFLPCIDSMVKDGFVTMEKVHVTKYRHKD